MSDQNPEQQSENAPEKQPHNVPEQQPDNIQGQPPFFAHDNLENIIPQSLPNSTLVLVLGILSIISCCCYGIVGLIFGVVGLILGNKDKSLYRNYPGAYTKSSYSNSNAGRICSIIGLILSALCLLFIIAFIVIFGFAAMKDPEVLKNMLEQMNNN